MSIEKIPLIILAAGKSSRMGHPKGLLKWKDTTLIEYQIEQFYGIGGKEILAVLGAFLDEYLDVTPELNYVTNEHVEDGPFSSIQIALRKLLTNNHKGFYILPVDVPAPDREVWEKLEKCNTMVGIPCFNGKGGHPVFISQLMAQRLMCVEKNENDFRLDKQIQKLGSDEVTRIEVSDSKILWNINTPQDLEKVDKDFRFK